MIKYDLIFVCHGNVNRSKMAEYYMKSINKKLVIDSFAAGIKSREGVLITKKTRGILLENNINFDPQSRSKLLTPEIVQQSRHIYCMDINNIIHYLDKYGLDYEEKLKLLPNLINLDKIKDPGFSKGVGLYKEVFSQIKDSCDILNSIIC